jgi:ABC-type transport system substrate-binding protein
MALRALRSRSLFRRFAAARRGATAVEFSLIATPFLALMFGVFELGLVFMVSTTLDNATEAASRTIRTGQLQSGGGSAGTFKAAVCDNMTWLGSSCDDKLTIDVRTFPKFADVSVTYLGFNMLDPTVGRGATPEQHERNRKLRQAISIAVDWEEYSRIFPKNAGEVAMSPLPAGLFGSRHGQPEGLNPVTHTLQSGKPQRRSIAEAKQLMVEAGYPDGRDLGSGRPLLLNYDVSSAPSPESRSQIDWMVKQFAKIDVQLEVRASDNNQFQEKVRQGKHQIYSAGWLAD